MQHVLGGSLHKNNTSYLLLGLYHASVNWLSIVLMQIPPKMNCIIGSVKKANVKKWGVTDFVLERTSLKEHPKSEKSGFVWKEGQYM